MEKLFYTVSELADTGLCSKIQIYRYIAQKKIKAIEIGSIKRIPRDEFLRITQEGIPADR